MIFTNWEYTTLKMFEIRLRNMSSGYLITKIIKYSMIGVTKFKTFIDCSKFMKPLHIKYQYKNISPK